MSSSQRGHIRERDISGLMGTEPVPRERISTERSSEKMSTEPPAISRETSLNGIADHAPPRKWSHNIPKILPHERVFPVQIGTELFKLSGASISSDAPSYFSQFFVCQIESAKERGEDPNSVKTLYIDRDPATFRDISLHLQGYHITPRDALHFVKLFADAQFYSLPRLISQLFEEAIFITIGNEEFRIPRDLFSDPGNSPNYFSLGFAVFFSTPSEVFPGLPREGLLRPPSIIPPAVPSRSADTFREILHLLRGYPLKMRSEEHRAELLRDCRYFHLKGLEQKLIRHEISYNLLRKRHEISLRLEDIRQSGVSIIGDPSSSPPPPDISNISTPTSTTSVPQSQQNLVGYINYARPFVDAQPYELLLQISSSETLLHCSSSRAEFFGETKARISRLLEVVATKLNLPTTQPLGLLMKRGGRQSQPPSPGHSGVSEDLVRVEISNDASVVLDGQEWKAPTTQQSLLREEDEEYDDLSLGQQEDWLSAQPHTKRRRTTNGESVRGGSESGIKGGNGVQGTNDGEEWVIRTGLWRLKVQNSKTAGRGGVECLLVAVKLDAVSGERGRNAGRGFL